MKFSPFETQSAHELNEARSTFLNSFMPELIRKDNITTALDVGCGGLGFFSRLMKELGLAVTAFDGRPENVAQARTLNPTIDFKVCDVEDPVITLLGHFDLVLCFGLLYHLENPFRAIRNLYEFTEKYLVIETQIAPHQSLGSVLYEEFPTTNQSLNYISHMPTERSVIKMLYKVGFAKVYRPCYLPEHPDFRASLTRMKIRTILIASKVENIERNIEWGAAKFCFVSEPKLTKLTPRNWDTNLGKLIRVVKEPVTTGLHLLSWLVKLLPPFLIVKACAYMAKPATLRLWPGWSVGAGHSSASASILIREALWTGFSDKCLDRSFTLPWHDRIEILAYPMIMTCRSLFVTGYYEPNELYLLKTILKPGMVFIDIGANIGLYTLFASRLVGKTGIVVAIEPSHREMERLRANVELNKGQGIRLIQTAISNRPGERELLIAEDEHSGQNTFGAFAYAGIQKQCKRRVKAETLDEVVKREALTRVDVIKMDVEGHEVFALEGAKETLGKFRPTLLVEISETALMHQGCTSSQILSFLDQRGYRMYIFSKQTGLPVPLDDRIENIYSENILAIHSSSGVTNDGAA